MAKYWYDVHKIAYVEEIESANTLVSYSGLSWMRTDGIDFETGLYQNGSVDKYAFIENMSYKYPFTSNSEPFAKKRFEVIADLQGKVRGDLYQIIATKSDFINRIKAEEDEYPENGILGDYWYIRGGAPVPNVTVKGHGKAKNIYIKTANGNVDVKNIYIVGNNGERIELK